jgi:Glycosyl transferase family group 2
MPASDTPRLGAPTLAVVIPAGDAPATLERCLAALAAGERAPDEVIVQSEPSGAGPAALRNAGVARSQAELVAFVDSDVEVRADALARIERHFAEDARLDGVFGAYDDDPAAPGVTSRFRNLLHHHVHSEAAGPAETFWAGLGAVRREAFAAVGGFDAGRFPTSSIEDIELGIRMRRGGARLLLDPRIRGRHLKAWTVASMLRTDFGRRGVPWVRLLLRDGGDRTALNLGRRHRLSALATLLLVAAALTRRPRLGAGCMALVLALNRRLYGLFARRGGAPLLLAGFALHLVHQLTAVAALIAGALGHLVGRKAR